jgi:hypothetical protein
MTFQDNLAAAAAAQAAANQGITNIAKTRRYVVAFSLEGVLNNAEKLRHKVGLAMKLLANLPDAQCDASTAATASTVITFYKVSSGTATSIGTLTWAASGTVPTISFPADVSFAAGDALELRGPATADTTLADIACTLLGHLL